MLTNIDLPDDIPPHPYAVAMEVAMLAPNAEVAFFRGRSPRSGIARSLLGKSIELIFLAWIGSQRSQQVPAVSQRGPSIVARRMAPSPSRRYRNTRTHRGPAPMFFLLAQFSPRPPALLREPRRPHELPIRRARDHHTRWRRAALNHATG